MPPGRTPQPPPPPPSPLPNVPTLIFSGEQDLRTPTANARQVAALIPDAQVEVVPFTGHSVVGSDLTAYCAADALKAFFAGAARCEPCASATVGEHVLAPTPLTPTKLAYVHPPARRPRRPRPGQTLVAVLDTLLDLNRQVIGATLQSNQELPSGASFGGLRGGFAKLTADARDDARLLAFVPGVRLTATFPIRNGKIQPRARRSTISGIAATPGTIRVGSATEASRARSPAGPSSLKIAKGQSSSSVSPGRRWPNVTARPRDPPRHARGARPPGRGSAGVSPFPAAPRGYAELDA